MLQWRGRLYISLLNTVHLIHTGLIDDWLRGSTVGSTNNLGLSRYFVKLSMRQPPTTTDSLLAQAVKDV